jgi:tetratricopeptide (TPR) repeat protein
MAQLIPDSLIEQIEKGRCSLFLGAGASMAAEFPSAAGLAQHLAAKAGNVSGVADTTPLDMVAQQLYLTPGYGHQWVRQTIIEYLEGLQRTVRRPPSEAHRLMTTIPWRTIFTTNYDRLIEIAYDSSSTAVQRVLPIYNPDPLMLRHQPHVVRAIKLNGSVDEAARNRSHSLVLTFAEQQEAKSKNAEFYNLLREEAINGPIIFVGFRFSHPGTSAPASAPEFFELQTLLRDLGPAAQWHYSVWPFDALSAEVQMFVNILRVNQVHAINADFGTFLRAVSSQLAAPRIALSARPIVKIPVGSRIVQISADEHENDLRHFEVLGSQVETLPEPSITESLNGRDNWVSYLKGHFIRRLTFNGLRDAVLNAFKHAPELLTVAAPPGWGKTTMLKQLATDFYKLRRPVVWLNPLSTVDIDTPGGNTINIGSWDTVRLDTLVHSLSDQGAEESATFPCIVADDCAERANDVVALFRTLSKNGRRFVLILALRDDEYLEVEQSHRVIKSSRLFRPDTLADPREEVQNLIDFCHINHVATFDDEVQRHLVAQRIVDEEASGSLLLALQVIFDHQHRPFAEIVRSVWGTLSSDDMRDLFLRVASWHRFGNSFQPRLYTLLQSFPSHKHKSVLEGYQNYLKKGLLVESEEEGEPCVSSIHSLWAAKLMDVADRDRGDLDDVLITLLRRMTRNVHDLELIRRLLKKVTDYRVTLSSDEKTRELFIACAEATGEDWVVSHQFANYLLQRSEFDHAFTWIDRALAKNPSHPPLHHTKGNILRRWGNNLLLEGKDVEANKRFGLARTSFATSRSRRDADEFGYVTHLDMLLHLINRASEDDKANLIAEGAQLYQKGMRAVPEERFNYLLEDRFKAFDLKGHGIEELMRKIQGAINRGAASVFAAAFLARQFGSRGQLEEAISVIRKQRAHTVRGLLLWVAEAELNARGGQYTAAAKAIDSGKRSEQDAEDTEVVWDLVYWDLVVSFILGDYGSSRAAAVRIANSGVADINNFPRGYIWKKAARTVPPDQRKFRDHAQTWQGRIENVRAGGHYGEISISNTAGERFLIKFNPRYWTRAHRRGDFVTFAVTMLPLGMRAEDINSKPFLRTVDDLFI